MPETPTGSPVPMRVRVQLENVDFSPVMSALETINQQTETVMHSIQGFESTLVSALESGLVALEAHIQSITTSLGQLGSVLSTLRFPAVDSGSLAEAQARGGKPTLQTPLMMGGGHREWQQTHQGGLYTPVGYAPASSVGSSAPPTTPGGVTLEDLSILLGQRGSKQARDWHIPWDQSAPTQYLDASVRRTATSAIHQTQDILNRTQARYGTNSAVDPYTKSQLAYGELLIRDAQKAVADEIQNMEHALGVRSFLPFHQQLRQSHPEMNHHDLVQKTIEYISTLDPAQILVNQGIREPNDNDVRKAKGFSRNKDVLEQQAKSYQYWLTRQSELETQLATIQKENQFRIGVSTKPSFNFGSALMGGALGYLFGSAVPAATSFVTGPYGALGDPSTYANSWQSAATYNLSAGITGLQALTSPNTAIAKMQTIAHQQHLNPQAVVETAQLAGQFSGLSGAAFLFKNASGVQQFATFLGLSSQTSAQLVGQAAGGGNPQSASQFMGSLQQGAQATQTNMQSFAQLTSYIQEALTASAHPTTGAVPITHGLLTFLQTAGMNKQQALLTAHNMVDSLAAGSAAQNPVTTAMVTLPALRQLYPHASSMELAVKAGQLPSAKRMQLELMQLAHVAQTQSPYVALSAAQGMGLTAAQALQILPALQHATPQMLHQMAAAFTTSKSAHAAPEIKPPAEGSYLHTVHALAKVSSVEITAGQVSLNISHALGPTTSGILQAGGDMMKGVLGTLGFLGAGFLMNKGATGLSRFFGKGSAGTSTAEDAAAAGDAAGGASAFSLLGLLAGVATGATLGGIGGMVTSDTKRELRHHQIKHMSIITDPVGSALAIAIHAIESIFNHPSGHPATNPGVHAHLQAAAASVSLHPTIEHAAQRTTNALNTWDQKNQQLWDHWKTTSQQAIASPRNALVQSLPQWQVALKDLQNLFSATWAAIQQNALQALANLGDTNGGPPTGGTTGVSSLKPVSGSTSPYTGPTATGSISSNVKHWLPQITQDASKYKTPAALIEAVMQQESSGIPQWSAHHKGYGLMQLSLGQFSPSDIFNNNNNIAAGTKYLAQQDQTFHNWLLALYAYNGGAGTVDTALQKYGNDPTKMIQYLQSKTNNYASDVLGHLGIHFGNASQTTSRLVRLYEQMASSALKQPKSVHPDTPTMGIGQIILSALGL